ncbi:zinc ABC transporter substrate-binding protein [Roseovarius rhodophyticola]|uniref:High-affinity zinc uptake system protein ZnuA n=1 Tax=Roseovarius rhodophyticola TaxID=3080827 RepID=A0ABZ2TC27_9RHOB|nr:zinc ABC transporter substrate-binding protein [Roseovarius sp. W115]MDV2931011.1 zinc ABC transporter substrate-binding protein [Roseovarius sp. W115]
MSRKLLAVSATASLIGSVAMAEAPRVAVDIAPVHSLVARVMEGVGAPALIVPPGASPHEYSLRPSEAQALQDADLVFWMGEDLTPWMAGAVATLAKGAQITTLLESEGTTLLEFREGALFEAHDHGHDAHDEDEHSHDDHAHKDEHDHEEHASEKDHDHDHDEHAHDATKEHDHDDHAHDDHAQDDHGHAHGAHDPHAWLSLDNADSWLNLIAAQLSATDPDNAGVYFANAATAREEMAALKTEVSGLLDPVRGGSFIVFHDAYQYFETTFAFSASGAISLSDATDPSPARVAEIQGRIRAEGIDCVLAEPQFNAGLVETVLDGTEANTGVIDPLGATLEPGSNLYPQLIRKMAKTLAACL